MKRFRPSATNRATLAALFVALVCACSLERSELDTVESTDASHYTHSKLDTRDIFDAATEQTESPQDVFVELLAPAGILKAVPESIDFGPQRVGMTGRRNFQLQNVGTEKVTVTSIEVSGGGGETLFGVELPA